MQQPPTYVGLDQEINGGMTSTGKIIRDAQVFGLIPEDETCAGWTAAGIETLWEKVNVEWEKHGFSVAALPDPLRARFLRIQSAAVDRARAAGWSGEAELSD